MLPLNVQKSIVPLLNVIYINLIVSSDNGIFNLILISIHDRNGFSLKTFHKSIFCPLLREEQGPDPNFLLMVLLAFRDRLQRYIVRFHTFDNVAAFLISFVWPLPVLEIIHVES